MSLFEASDAQRWVITHIDFKPPFADAGRELLLRHVENLRSASGLTRCDLVQQTAHANHFELITIWESDESYEGHRSLDATVALRTEVYPMLGSPWDDRVHRVIGSTS